MKRIVLLPCLLVTQITVGCGGSSQEPNTADTAPQDERPDYDSTAQIGATAEVGALPEEEAIWAFKESFEDIQKCFVTGSRRIEFIGGQISFQVWVDSSGGVQTVFAEQSTLGDRETEECMYDVLRAAPWPRPVGGPIAVAQNAFEFEMTGDVRPPVDWDSEQVAEVLEEHREQIAQCKHGARESFLATVYVATDGRAMSVGMAAPDREVAESSRCLVDVLSQASYPAPGSWPAKVSFAL